MFGSLDARLRLGVGFSLCVRLCLLGVNKGRFSNRRIFRGNVAWVLGIGWFCGESWGIG